MHGRETWKKANRKSFKRRGRLVSISEAVGAENIPQRKWEAERLRRQKGVSCWSKRGKDSHIGWGTRGWVESGKATVGEERGGSWCQRTQDMVIRSHHKTFQFPSTCSGKPWEGAKQESDETWLLSWKYYSGCCGEGMGSRWVSGMTGSRETSEMVQWETMWDPSRTVVGKTEGNGCFPDRLHCSCLDGYFHACPFCETHSYLQDEFGHLEKHPTAWKNIHLEHFFLSFFSLFGYLYGEVVSM